MTAANQLEVSVALTQAVLESLRSLQVDAPERLLGEVGIASELLNKPENRIPFEQQQALWALAVECADSANFGLHFARSIQPTSFGLVGFMAMNCRTIGECFAAMVKYQFLAGQGGEFSLAADDKHAALIYTPVNPMHPVTQQRVVAMLAASVSFGRWLVGDALQPQSVHFAHAASGRAVGARDVDEYTEFFGAPVSFGEADSRVVYAPEVLELQVPNASEELLQLLSGRANRLLQSLSGQSGIAARIALLLASQLNNRVPDKALIATQLGMSERTMQRRLRDEGTSYQSILDRSRHYLARELLLNTRLPLSDIAAQLGFAEPSAFYRAFRKWQGATPGQFRQQS
tara:strand:- start:187685 stop:188719 length:1035 start_codon:yes stop_codon:yes gene_type:complete